jgi:hypothetical protein
MLRSIVVTSEGVGTRTHDRSVAPGVARWTSVVLATGLALVVFADAIADAIETLLPGRATIRSSGSPFEPFGEVGSDIVARTGWITIASMIVALVATRFSPRIASRPVHLALTTTLVVATAAWYGWLSTPHNAFVSNARYHWVDYITWDTDDYFYALGRIPHRIFYDAPWMWQAINAAIAVTLCYLIARRLGIGRGLSTTLAAFVAVSGNLLVFAGTAEDVLLSTTVMLLFGYASLRRQGWLVGLAIVLLVLARPPFAIVALAVPLGELISSMRARERPDRERVVYVATAAAVAAAGVTLSQIYFTIAGRRYFLANGRLIDVPELQNLEPIAVDGFTLSAWSGAFALHWLWVIPIFTLVAAVAGVLLARRQTRQVEATVYTVVCAAVLQIAVLEANPLFYYNVRYLTYTVPLLAIAGWSVLVPHPATNGETAQASTRLRYLTVAAMVALGPLAIPADPVGVKRAVEARDETELLAVRDELRRLAESRQVYVEFGTTSTRNYLAYVLRDDRDRITMRSEDGPGVGLVITRIEDAPAGVPAALTTESFVVYLNE